MLSKWLRSASPSVSLCTHFLTWSANVWLTPPLPRLRVVAVPDYLLTHRHLQNKDFPWWLVVEIVSWFDCDHFWSSSVPAKASDSCIATTTIRVKSGPTKTEIISRDACSSLQTVCLVQSNSQLREYLKAYTSKHQGTLISDDMWDKTVCTNEIVDSAIRSRTSG